MSPLVGGAESKSFHKSAGDSAPLGPDELQRTLEDSGRNRRAPLSWSG